MNANFWRKNSPNVGAIVRISKEFVDTQRNLNTLCFRNDYIISMILGFL